MFLSEKYTLSLPSLRRIIPAPHHAYWNSVKTGSDTCTKLMDSCRLIVPHAHSNCLISWTYADIHLMLLQPENLDENYFTIDSAKTEAWELAKQEAIHTINSFRHIMNMNLSQTISGESMVDIFYGRAPNLTCIKNGCNEVNTHHMMISVSSWLLCISSPKVTATVLKKQALSELQEEISAYPYMQRVVQHCSWRIQQLPI